MFGRDVLNKDELVSRLEAMARRKAKHGDTFDFEFYVAMTFASDKLVDEVAALTVSAKDQAELEAAFAKKMSMFAERFGRAPTQMRKSLVHHLGRRHGKLESFDDLPGLLERLSK